MTKCCSKCNEVKPLTDFHKRAVGKNGLNPQCKVCQAAYAKVRNSSEQERLATRRRALKGFYNIDLATYNNMLEAQGGVCAICGTADAHSTRNVSFAVDHCHSTGIVRGLLCNSCNMGLGYFKDNPHSLAQAIAYLGRHIKQ